MGLLLVCTFVCGLAAVNGQGFQLFFGTTTQTGGFDQNCRDKLSDCHKFEDSSCQAPYTDWARENCPQRCGFCIGPTTAAPPCTNKLATCETYGQAVCSKPEYKTWVYENCRYWCRLCTPAQLAMVDAIKTTLISPQNCVDKVDCKQYGANACSASFRPWAKDNCPAYCQLCTGIPTPPPTCDDKLPNCKQFNSDTCTNPKYKLWVEDNCRKHCGVCTGQVTAAPVGGYNTPPNPGSGSGGYVVPPNPGSGGYPVPAVPGRDPAVITYVPPTPPLGRKRSIVRRQFHASHHHFGGEHSCWDHTGHWKSDDPYCKTPAPGELTTEATVVIPSVFPGSEYSPRPTPTEGWDKKPSPTTTTTEATTTTTEAVPTTTTTAAATTTTIGGVTVTPPSGSSSQASTTATAAPPVTNATVSTPNPGTLAPVTVSPQSTIGSSSATAAPPVTNAPVTTPNPDTPPTVTSSTQATTASTTFTAAPPVTNAPVLAPNPGTPPTVTSTTQTTIASTTITAAPTVTIAPVTTPNPGSPPTVTSTTQTIIASTTTTAAPTVTNAPVTTPNAVTPPIVTSSPQTTIASTTTTAAPTATNGPKSTSNPGTTPIVTSSPQTTIASSPQGSSSTSPSPPLTTTPASLPNTTTAEKCEDTIDNCAQYGPSMCKSTTYGPWSHAHCSAFCQFCTPVTLTPFKCEDAIPNCAEFDGGDLCTAQTYFAWSRENCFAYCGYPPCGTKNITDNKSRTADTNSTTQALKVSIVTQPTTTANQATNPPGTCADVRDDCLLYPDKECTGIYEAWAKAHCAFRCGFCNETLPCVDTNADCDLFPSDICTNPTEAGWARQNCRKFCNMCTTITHGSNTGQSATPGGAVSSKKPLKGTTTIQTV